MMKHLALVLLAVATGARAGGNNVPQEPVDCEFEVIAGACDAKCGGGQMLMSSKITRPPMNEGTSCPEDYYVSCNTHPCPECGPGLGAVYSEAGEFVECELCQGTRYNDVTSDAPCATRSCTEGYGALPRYDEGGNVAIQCEDCSLKTTAGAPCHFSDDADDGQCKPCTPCASGYYEEVAPTASADRVCAAWGGSCANGELRDLELRTNHDQCGACNSLFALDDATARCESMLDTIAERLQLLDETVANLNSEAELRTGELEARIAALSRGATEVTEF